MAQGILTNSRVRLMMAKGATHYRPRRVGERKRRSVRGCIVGADLAVLNLVIVKSGAKPIAGLTNPEAARAPRLGKKRASKIRKVYNLTREDDVRKYVVTRKIVTKKKKETQKRPKIQRLVTPLVLQHKAERTREIKKARELARTEKATYEALIQKSKAEHRASLKARRSSRKSGAKDIKA
jgi:small subunit ribosomal protein S6e